MHIAVIYAIFFHVVSSPLQQQLHSHVCLEEGLDLTNFGTLHIEATLLVICGTPVVAFSVSPFCGGSNILPGLGSIDNSPVY